MVRSMLIAMMTLALVGCDDPAARARNRFALLQGKGASELALCEQAKKVKVAGDIIVGKYEINRHCLSIDPETDPGAGRDIV